MARPYPRRFRHARMAAALVVSSSLLLSACGGGEEAADDADAWKTVDATPTVHTPTGEKSTSSKPTKTKTSKPKSTGKPKGASNKDAKPGEPLPFPEEAKENTAEGAEAYVRWQWGSLNNILLDPKHGSGKVLNPKGCLHCKDLEDVVDKAAHRKVHFTGPYATVEEVEVDFLVSANRWAAVVDFSQGGTEVVDADGEIDSVVKDNRQTYEIVLRYADGQMVPIEIARKLS